MNYVTTLQGDCIDVLPTLADRNDIYTCVTSPPYYGLRDYGLPPTEWPAVRYAPMAGLPEMEIPPMTCCLGLEPTPEAYIGHLVYVFRLVRDALREDGTCWVNMGDSYAANRGYQVPDSKWGDVGNGMSMSVSDGLKPKDLMMTPARLALALQADGWWLRSDVVWSKTNPMPESVTDRPTKAHEYVFLLSKSARYYYDADAIAEPLSREYTGTAADGGLANRANQKHSVIGNQAQGDNLDLSQQTTRNKRTVWELSTRPYPEAHFAVYPPELIEPCVLAGCPETVCAVCGAAWERVTEEKRKPTSRNKAEESWSQGTGQTPHRGFKTKKTVITRGFTPTCDCDDDTRPGVVLDPFAGSGTTGMVAAMHRRRALLVELSADYCDLHKERTTVQMELPV